jgi:hypothetical protein
MVKIKEMSFREKYQGVLDGMALLEEFALPIVKEDLGEEKLAELKSEWLKQSEPIPENASDQEKYEIAFRNWLRNWQRAYDLVRDALGERGTEKFIRRAVDAWEKKNAGPALYILGFVKAVAPQKAFRTFGTQIAYQFQPYTPYSISEFNGKRMVLKASHCKFLDVEGCNDPCKVACQKIVPLWMKEQFKVKMALEPVGKSCTITFTPL